MQTVNELAWKETTKNENAILSEASESYALVPFEETTKEVKVIDRTREKYLRRVGEVLGENKTLEAQAHKERYSSALAIKEFQNKTRLELGLSQSPDRGFFITNPEHETSVNQPILALPMPSSTRPRAASRGKQTSFYTA